MRLCGLTFVVPLAFLTSGCSTLTSVDDLQEVFGPSGIALNECEMSLDLNGDGKPERVVLFTGERNLPPNVLSDLGGVIVDGFAVFDGTRPNVPVFYQYSEYRYQIRLDTVDGQQVLVSDGGRDHVQHVWGWWSYPGFYPPTTWRALDRAWDQQQERFGPWINVEKILVIVGKTIP